MFQRILLPLDGSDLSAQAIPYAAEMAKRFDAEMFLLRSVPPVSVPGFEAGTMTDPASAENLLEAVKGQEAQTIHRAETYLKEHAKGLRDQGLKVSIEAVVGPSDSREGIILATSAAASSARGWRSDLVAAASWRRAGAPVSGGR